MAAICLGFHGAENPHAIIALGPGPLGLSASRVAERIDVPANRITSIVKGERSVTADTAIRLGRLFGTTAEFWINLQSHYELELAKSKVAEETVRAIRPLVREMAVA